MAKHYVPVRSPFANDPKWFVGPFVSKAAAQKWIDIIAKDAANVKVWPELPKAGQYRWVVFPAMSVAQIKEEYDFDQAEIEYRTLPAETLPTVKDLRQAGREWKERNRK